MNMEKKFWDGNGENPYIEVKFHGPIIFRSKWENHYSCRLLVGCH